MVEFRLWKWSAIALLAIWVTPSLAAAQQIIDFRESGPDAGQRFVFAKSNGDIGWLEVIDALNFVNDSGKPLVKNRDGNSLISGDTRFEPHSGYRPPDSRGALQVGQSWKHKYEREGIRRTRKCEVTANEDLVTAHVIVKSAFKVECTNKRADRKYPMHEEIWFAPNFFPEVKYEAKWYGSSPGSFGFEITSME